MRICELKQKEVINIHTCRSLGYSIPWDCIRQIGEDIILVDFRNEKLLSGE